MLAVKNIGDTDVQTVCVTVSPTTSACVSLSPKHRNHTYIEKVSPKNGPINPFCANARAIPGLVKGAFRATYAQFRPHVCDFWANALPQLDGQKIAGLSRDKEFLYTHPVLSFPQVDRHIGVGVQKDKKILYTHFLRGVNPLFYVPAMAGGDTYA